MHSEIILKIEILPSCQHNTTQEADELLNMQAHEAMSLLAFNQTVSSGSHRRDQNIVQQGCVASFLIDISIEREQLLSQSCTWLCSNGLSTHSQFKYNPI